MNAKSRRLLSGSAWILRGASADPREYAAGDQTGLLDMSRRLNPGALIKAAHFGVGAGAAILLSTAVPLAFAQNSDNRQASVQQSLNAAEAAVTLAEAAAGRHDTRGLALAVKSWSLLADNDKVRTARLWSAVAGAAFARDDFRAAAEAALLWQQALPAGGAAAAVNLHSIARLLAFAPPQQVERYEPVGISLRKDLVGLPRATFDLNGKRAEAVLDTGANLSTASAAAASKYGLRYMDGDASVGSATKAAVAARLAIADRLDIAGITLSNVVFLVLPDEQLKLPVPDYRLDLIIGFPVFRAMERVTFSQPGSLIPSRSVAGLEPRNLRYEGSTIFIEAEVASKPVWMHLDTGARMTSLPADFANRNEMMVRGLARRTVRFGGAGGVVEQEIAILPNAEVRIDEHSVSVPEITVLLSSDAQSSISNRAQLGQDVIGQYQAFTIDFLAGRFDVQ